MRMTKVNKMTDERTIELYIGYVDNTWSTVDIEVIDEGIFSVEDLVHAYMKEHADEFENMAFYGIYHIPNFEEW